MKDIDLAALSKLSDDYKQLSDTLKKKYNCSWNDSVHESFRAFTASVESTSEDLIRINGSVNTTMDSVKSLNVDNLKNRVDSLVNEVNAV